MTEGKIPVYQNSLTPLGYYKEANYPADTTFIISAGAAGNIGFSKMDFWAADDCICLVCDKNLNSKYLYYTMTNRQCYFLSRVRKASVPRLSRETINKFEIAIPPYRRAKPHSCHPRPFRVSDHLIAAWLASRDSGTPSAI